MNIRPWLGPVLVSVLLAACGSRSEGAPVPEDPPQGGEEQPVSRAEGPVAEADAFIARQTIDKTNPRWKTRLPKPPKFTFDPAKTYTWVLETNQGTMRFKLRADVAPMHVSSTIYLTRVGFYDDLGFHRVIQGFMAQGGCPLGTGTGGPGYEYDGEFSRTVIHDRPGLLSMANRGPGTDGSQFFITFGATPHLNGKHTIFGELSRGSDVLQKFEALGKPGTAPDHTPRQPIKIVKATIEVE
jgi:cyclophilin family peptidyl-prolyl cis-trans isomerase